MRVRNWKQDVSEAEAAGAFAITDVRVCMFIV